MRRVAWAGTAAVVVLGIAAFAGARAVGTGRASAAARSPAAKGTPAVGAAASAVAASRAAASRAASSAAASSAAANAPGVTSVKGATSTMYSLTAGGLKRRYEVIAPDRALPKSAPIIVMLSGLGANVPGEIGRDRLVDYASAGQAEVIYPVAFDESWNVDGCCGQAGTKKVNDLAFMRALVAAADPRHTRPAYVVGYSNGARLAYQVACEDPALFDGYALVKGGPVTNCAIREPVNIVVMASVNDPEVPYRPGDRGSTGEKPVTTVVARLRAAEKCPAKNTVTHSGMVTQTTWTGCADGTRLALAAWSGGVHSFPRPPGSVPAASQVAWAFFTNTPLAPLPD